jgi:hypothetical protein
MIQILPANAAKMFRKYRPAPQPQVIAHMPLNSFLKTSKKGCRKALAWMAVSTFLLLPGCISSNGPILSDAKAILGERGQIHIFATSGSGGREHSVVSFRWSGSRYVVSGRSLGISDFTAHAYEGRDLIVQSRATRAPHPTEYALARKIADGAYLVTPISEDDADDATRERFCSKTPGASCRISTPEQLFVFARATAAKEQDNSGIAVIVPAKGR